MTIVTPMKSSATELRRRWRRQIGIHAFQQSARRPREGAALGFYYPDKGSKLVPLDCLRTVIVFDDPDLGVQLRGYRPRLVGDAVDWTADVVLRKSLSLSPRPYARGRRLDSRWQSLCDLALRLDHRLQQAQRHLRRIEQTPIRWPRLWAAFSPEAAERLTGRGDELSALCRKFKLSRRSMLTKFSRAIGGRTLVPKNWVDQPGDSVWADLSGVTPRQAISEIHMNPITRHSHPA